MFDDNLRGATAALVRGRGKALGGRLASLARTHANASREDLAPLISKASREEKPILGLLLARVILEDALNEASSALLNDFLFRYAAHLKTSASMPGLYGAQRLVLAVAAEQAFQSLPTATSAQLADISDMKRRLDGPLPEENVWRGVMGMTNTEYRDCLETIKTQLGSFRRPRPPEERHHSHLPAKSMALKDSPPFLIQRVGGPTPPWLRAEFSSEGDPLLTATANWDPSSFQGETRFDIETAWDCFTRNDYVGARSSLGSLYASIGMHWGPTPAANDLRTWHWLRLVSELAALEADEVLDHRRSAISALEFAQRCLPGDDQLIDKLLGSALNDFAASDLATSRAWCAYTARAVACLDHESALASYANDEKAALRKAWQVQFSLLPSDIRSTATMALALMPKYRTVVQRLYVSARDKSDTTRVLREVGRDFASFLDETEGNIFSEAQDLLVDGRRALGAEKLNHRELREQASALIEMRRTIALSGSLLLQDYLAPHLALLIVETADAETRLGDISRPEVTVRLESARLPLSATAGTPYSIRLIATNSGNTSAERISARLVEPGLGIDVTVALMSLGAGAEEYIEMPVLATGFAQPAVSLTCYISWSDLLFQQFSSEQILAAEDQKPASWTSTDVNPFSLGTISDPSRLVGRDDDLASLEALLAGGGSAYVTGHKRVGKTSLIRVLISRTSRDRAWAGEVMSLGRALGPEQLAADLVYALMDEILNAVTQSYREATSGLRPVEPEVSGNFARAANRWLRGVQGALPADARVVVAIDDFDELPPHLVSGPQADALFLFLRSLVDEPWLNLIVVGSEILPTIIQGQAHKLNQVVPVSVTNFSSRASTASLLVPPTVDRLEWDPASIDRIHHICRGNPYYETLVAQQLWHDLREKTRSFVTVADIDAAALGVAKSAPASHFVHLWADSAIGLDHTSRPALVTSGVLRAVARCGGARMVVADAEEVVRIAQTWIQTATAEELHQTINSLVTREVLERGPSENSLLMCIPLVSTWLMEAGGRALDGEYAASIHASSTARVVTESDLAELSRGLRYGGEHISEIRIQAWLNQFGDHYHQYLAYRMLRRLVGDGYFTAARLHQVVMPKLRDNLSKLPSARQILRDNNGYLNNAYIMEHGRSGDSTQGTLSSLCKTLKVKKANVVAATDMATKLRLSEAGAVIFILDDYSGSGMHLTNALGELLQVLPNVADDWQETVHIVVGAGIVSDMARLPTSPEGVTVEQVSGMILGARYRAFDPASGVFENPKEREDAHDLVMTIGRALLPNNPLGFGQDALLTLLEFNCPNNVPPVFWRKGAFAGRPWFPLFERSL